MLVSVPCMCFFFSHTIALCLQIHIETTIQRKKICVKMNGVDSSLNVEKTIIFQGKMVVCGSAQL